MLPFDLVINIGTAALTLMAILMTLMVGHEVYCYLRDVLKKEAPCQKCSKCGQDRSKSSSDI